MMALVSAVLPAVTTCLWLQSVSGRDDLDDQKVWSLGVTAQLHCNNSAQYPTAPASAEPVSWMLPNLTVLHVDRGRFQIVNDNWTLKVVNVSQADLGLYRCMLRAGDVNWLVLRVGLNTAGGPYFEDLWDKYWRNTVTGLSASFGFLFIATAVCLLYHFRYRQREDLNVATPGELTGDDGAVTVVGVVDRNVEMKAAPDNHEKSAPSSTLSSKEVSYVAQTYSGNCDPECIIECNTLF